MNGWTQQHIDDLKREGHRDKNAKAVPEPAPVKAMLEKELQGHCEWLLRLRHYRSMTAANSVTVGVLCNLAGWYIHVPQAQGNPLFPDIMVLPYPNDRPVLMVELKVRKKFQPGQKEMIENGMWKLAWSVEEFEAILTEWEGR
jgi:hypothetical protein